MFLMFTHFLTLNREVKISTYIKIIPILMFTHFLTLIVKLKLTHTLKYYTF
jgi:hypothetical protein